MHFPSDYLDLVLAGTDALRAIGQRAREFAASTPGRPEAWLAVRDYEGLAGRLAGLDDWSWRRGFADLEINGQDLGVLDELIARTGAPIVVTDSECRVLSQLRDFLGRYSRREYEFVRASVTSADAEE